MRADMKTKMGTISHRLGNVMLLCGVLLICLPSAAPAQQRIDEVVVWGRQPGPPLWRVSNGEHVLWILPLVPAVPRDMIWDDDRVASVIRDADAAIGSPDISLGVSKLVLFNPINWIRGARLLKRVSANPGDATLKEVLPAPTYARYAAMKARYFPKDKDIDELRPAFATGRISSAVLNAEQLTGSGSITKRVDKLIRRNRDIRYTDITIEEQLEGSFGELKTRIEALADSLPQDGEIACFEAQLTRFERHIGDMKMAANAWASGSARHMEDLATTVGLQDPCTQLLLGSSEADLLENLLARSTRSWLDAAADALERNASTFSMLPMVYITGDLSLTDRLAEMGFAVHRPN
jgi:TraB/PrgY/gumN family